MTSPSAARQVATLGEVVRRHAQVRAASTAFEFEGHRITYGDFDRLANRVAHALASSGVAKGDRVAYLAKNTATYFALLVGASRIGAVMVPVNWRLAPAEIEQILGDCETPILFVGSEFGAVAATVVAALDRPIRQIALENDVPGLEPFDHFHRDFAESEPAHTALAEDPVLQLYTSGTTGLPKGAVLSHRALVQQRHDLRAAETGWALWDEQDVSLLAMPVFHISGSGWGNYALFAGARSIVIREFDPAKVLDFIQQEKVSRLFLVPAAIKILLDDPRADTTDFSCLRGIIYGASPIPDQLLARALRALGPILVQHYGLTETTGSVVALDVADHHPPGNPRLQSCGRAIAGAEVRIVDGEGRPVPPRTPGEIQIRSSSNMTHYWKQPEATRSVLTADNWFTTGDAAWMDEDGYVFILDRIKDMIISGGENIYPIEVENGLFGHPAIDDVAVIGVPDDRWGEAVHAVIVLRAGFEPDIASFDRWARERIAGYKVPKSYRFVPTLPRNPSGKILRRELRAEAWADRERQVN